ncbi:hypothetical protein M9458_047171, partial [Cirrhinus mrigala]
MPFPAADGCLRHGTGSHPVPIQEEKLRHRREGRPGHQVGSPGAAVLPPGPQWMARAKDTNARDFHFEVRHCAGATNANADRLSRIWTAYAGLSGHSPPTPHFTPT